MLVAAVHEAADRRQAALAQLRRLVLRDRVDQRHVVRRRNRVGRIRRAGGC